MTRVRVHNFSISLDGFGTGDVQSLENPMGHAGQRMHAWMIGTDAFSGSGKRGIENDMAANATIGIGAMVMGRNMFSPYRGAHDDSWTGWWGENPPYHHPVFVMTHYPRPSLEMEGGTTFHFVTATPQEVLQMAKEAAGEQDVQICGGVATVREYLRLGLIDEASIAIAPIILARGERLWDGLDSFDEMYEIVESVAINNTIHQRILRRS